MREFQGRHTARPFDTGVQITRMVNHSNGKRLTYEALIGQEATRNPRML